MTTHPPSHDEIALPRFETRLWAELEREHQAQLDGDTPDEPVPLLLPLDPRRRSRRPRLRPLTIGVASAAAVAAVVVAVVAWPNDGSPDREAVTAGRDTAETTEPTTEPAQADLAQRIAAANTDGASDAIVHVRQDNATYGDDETWRDEATGHFRSLQHDEDGSPSYDSGAAAVPGEGGDQQTTRTVDYCFEQYTEGPETLPVGPGSATPWIRTGLEDGTLIVDGTQTVDGRELILLREVMPPDDPIEHGPDGTPRLEAEERTPANAPTTGTLRITTSTTATLPPDETAEREAEEAAAEQEAEEDAARREAEEDAARREAEEAAARREAEEDAAREAADEVMGWVLIDPETYRPVIVVGYPSGDEFTMTDAEYVQTYEYLPRTAENLAELVVPVPEGFAQVEDLRGDGERADAGCGP